MFKLLYGKRVRKDLENISMEETAKIFQIIKSLHEEPRPRRSKKLEGRGFLYRIRQGNYRIIYEINYNDKEIKIVLIKHRKEAYRQL